VNLRRYLNSEQAFADLHDRSLPGFPGHRHPIEPTLLGDAGPGALHAHGGGANGADANFDDADADAIDDEDVLDDGSEMVIDTQPLLLNAPSAAAAHLGVGHGGGLLAALAALAGAHQEGVTDTAQLPLNPVGWSTEFSNTAGPALGGLGDADAAMDLTPAAPSHAGGGSSGNTAVLGGFTIFESGGQGPNPLAAAGATTETPADLSGSGSSSSIGDAPGGA